MKNEDIGIKILTKMLMKLVYKIYFLLRKTLYASLKIANKQYKQLRSDLNKNFVDFSVRLLIKEKKDYIFSFFIFTFIVFIITSVLFVSNSVKRDLLLSVQNGGEVIVKNSKSGRYTSATDEEMDDILQINGVEDVIGMVDGYYNFTQDRRVFHIVADNDLNDTSMIISDDVARELKSFKYEKEFNFLVKDKAITLNIDKILESTILTNNTIFVNSDNAREILEMDEDEYSFLNVIVPNKDEIENIALKIARLYPNLIAIPDYELKSDYEHLYYYKGGIFMILYIVSLVSFFILLKNQISAIYGSRRKEIAILRSMGFSIRDIILVKFIQNSIVAFAAYFAAIFLSYLYVFVLDAPLLRNIFLGSGVEDIVFTPVVDIKMLFLVFVFTVVPYLAAILIPSWRLAIEDVSEAMK